MTVRTGTDDLIVDRKPAFEDNDRLGSRVAMHFRFETGRVADEVMLRPRSRVLVQKPHPDLAVIDDRPGSVCLDRTETVHDDRLATFHAPDKPRPAGQMWAFEYPPARDVGDPPV
jgi:hypothetical protein